VNGNELDASVPTDAVDGGSVTVEPEAAIVVLVVDDEATVDPSDAIEVVVVARATVVEVVLVEVLVVVEVVVEADDVQSNGSQTVTPVPMFHVSDRKPCLPVTNAVTSIGKSAGATPWYGNVNEASSVTGTTPAGGGVVPYTKCSVMNTTDVGSTMSM
jgi:hypothetical protein